MAYFRSDDDESDDDDDNYTYIDAANISRININYEAHEKLNAFGVIACIIMKMIREILSIMHSKLFKVQDHLPLFRLAVSFWYVCKVGGVKALTYANVCHGWNAQLEDAMQLLEKV